MQKIGSWFVLTLAAFASVDASRKVANIADCPALKHRAAPKSVHDLRVDDIKVVGALGDSITAGFSIEGYDTSLSPSIAALGAYTEYRGLSYSIGGDEAAFTVANYVKHYSSKITGFSLGSHIAESCNAENCTSSYVPNQDNLNAAQTGAMAMNLDHEIDYLINRTKQLAGIDFHKDWKMINIQIGSNDMCGACNTTYMNEVTSDKYGNYLAAAVEKIRTNIPKTLVNLIGTFRVSEIFPLTAGQEYCRIQGNNSDTIINRQECPCGDTPEGLVKMDKLNTAYNEKLVEIYNHYREHKSDDFAVVYQHANLNISGFPIDFFSNFDCFHPSLKGHQWTSKIVWNQLFSPQAHKPKVFNFSTNETIYCPVDSDRIATN